MLLKATGTTIKCQTIVHHYGANGVQNRRRINLTLEQHGTCNCL